MKGKVVIVNYGMGNLQSVKKKIDQLYPNVLISSDHQEIADADKLILPGVGHFHKAMENIHALNLLDILNEKALIRQTPILGICLGMQLMGTSSEEGDAKGLNWFDAETLKIKVNDSLRYKIPHMGWNQVQINKQSDLMKGVPENSEFYFVHAYHVQVNNEADVLTSTTYESSFHSSIERDNIFGVQFHPEKSHDTGLQLINNFIQL